MSTELLRTPTAPNRSCPSTGPRAPSKPRPVTYSAAPLCTVDENSLVSSRFVNPHARRLAYRDVSGRVNLALCQRSLSEADENVDTDAEIQKLGAWERHARRAIAARPADELCTLEEMLAEATAAEALPISLRKPHRAAAPLSAEPTPVPASSLASRAVAIPETVVVLPPLASRAGGVATMGDSPRVAPHTISMQRRLFRLPQPGDEPSDDDKYEAEPSVDLYYVRHLAEEAAGRRGARSPSSASEAEADVFEVAAILKEHDGRFLIRWEGYGPEDDTWEPEENISDVLVLAFRDKRRRMASHAGDDYVDGRTRMLWCCTCREHRPADCFSSNQRRLAPVARSCLNHHYRVDGVTPATPKATGRAAGKRKQRSEHESPAPPLLQAKARRSAQSSRDADREVARCRLYGFSSW